MQTMLQFTALPGNLGVSPFPGSLLSNNALAFADLDGDGDLDAFEATGLSGLRYFENTGTSTAPSFPSSPTTTNPFGLDAPLGPGSGVYFSVSFGDLDNDGDFDILAHSGGVVYVENVGTPDAPSFVLPDPFERFGLPELGTGLGGGLAPILVDIDSDGDLDAFVQDGTTDYYENIGNANAPNFVASQVGPFDPPNPFGLSGGFNNDPPRFADLDRDGDLDAFFNDLRFAENTGTPNAASFEPPTFNFPGNIIGLMGTNVARPVFVDLNSDGNLDILNASFSAAPDFYRNDSDALFAPVADSENPLDGMSAVISPTFGDIDGDGDLDAFLAANNSIRYLENTGTVAAPNFAAPIENPFGLSGFIDFEGSFSLVDIDGDGDLDAFVTNSIQNTYLENIGNSTTPNFVLGSNPFGRNDPFFGPPGPSVGARTFGKLNFFDADGDGDLDVLSGSDNRGAVFFKNVGTRTEPELVDGTPAPSLTSPNIFGAGAFSSFCR